MKIEEILQIIWNWSQSQPAKYTSEQVKVQKKTVLSWYKKLQDICTAQMCTSTKMVGPCFELQIDESLFKPRESIIDFVCFKAIKNLKSLWQRTS